MSLKFKRLLAAWLDLFIISAMISVVLFAFQINKYVVYVLGCSLFFAKDVFGKSIGKIIMGLKIVNTNGVTPSKIILLFRNVLTAIWPVDVVVILIKNKKICDYLFNTSVIEKAQLR